MKSVKLPFSSFQEDPGKHPSGILHIPTLPQCLAVLGLPGDWADEVKPSLIEKPEEDLDSEELIKIVGNLFSLASVDREKFLSVKNWSAEKKREFLYSAIDRDFKQEYLPFEGVEPYLNVTSQTHDFLNIGVPLDYRDTRISPDLVRDKIKDYLKLPPVKHEYSSNPCGEISLGASEPCKLGWDMSEEIGSICFDAKAFQQMMGAVKVHVPAKPVIQPAAPVDLAGWDEPPLGDW